MKTDVYGLDALLLLSRTHVIPEIQLDFVADDRLDSIEGVTFEERPSRSNSDSTFFLRAR